MEKAIQKLRKNKITFLLLLLALVFLGMVFFTERRMQGLNQPDYSAFSRSEQGVGLLCDTLRLMGYPVSVLYQPLGMQVDVEDVVVIIQPENPRPNNASEMLYWVYQGGRLIFLENRTINFIDLAMGTVPQGGYGYRGTLRRYTLGQGEIFTGRAEYVVNYRLMEAHGYGAALAELITEWNPRRVLFAEYYHGFHATGNTFSQLPLGLRLMAFQLILGSLAAVWHFGKRFGKPLPLYEEIERDENEHVQVLARLYNRAKNAKKK